MSQLVERAITVFCSSSARIAPVYLDAAAELGDAIAREGWQLVYGGNNLGSMGALADACRAAGGRVIGITPQLFVNKGFADRQCHTLEITPDMRTRRARMEELADAFITLPGGFGTLEEISEVLVGRLLKCHSKPVILLNTAGFYAPLLDLFEKMIAGGFASADARKLYTVVNTVSEAIATLRAHCATSLERAAV